MFNYDNWLSGGLAALSSMAGLWCYSYLKARDARKKAKALRSNKNIATATKTVEVKLPKEKFVTATYEDEGKPFVCLFNKGIMELEPKIAFPWYLSLIISYDKICGEWMPDGDSVVPMQDFSDKLCAELAVEPEHPNALFLGRRTGDGFTQMMWYVNNPEVANNYLQALIESGNYPFEFDYQMTSDPEWKEAHYWLEPLAKR